MRAVTWNPAVWKDDWKHLRVPFQMTLAPIFLWGYFLSGARPTIRLLPAFGAFHLLLYTGITAFNSYYDRDHGPVGGMEHPPPVHASLLPLSLALQAAGAPVAAAYGRALLVIYLTFVALGVLYSHPRTRWKASPWLSAFVVCGGQGGLGFLAGWAAARGGLQGAAGAAGLLGCAAAALTTLGMYPLTQVYQVAEDAARGDRTLCVVLGEEGGLRMSQAALLLAGAASAAVVARHYTRADAVLIALAYLALVSCVGSFRRRFRALRPLDAFRTVRALTYGGAAAFSLFIVCRLARW